MNGTIHFFAPGLKHYDVEGLNTEGSCGLVAVSVTGAGCALNCKHCGKSILRAMAPTPTPEALLAEAKRAAAKGAPGLLVSGGSLSDGSVPLEPFFATMKAIREELGLPVLVHTGTRSSSNRKGPGMGRRGLRDVGHHRSRRHHPGSVPPVGGRGGLRPLTPPPRRSLSAYRPPRDHGASLRTNSGRTGRSGHHRSLSGDGRGHGGIPADPWNCHGTRLPPRSRIAWENCSEKPARGFRIHRFSSAANAPWDPIGNEPTFWRWMQDWTGSPSPRKRPSSSAKNET